MCEHIIRFQDFYYYIFIKIISAISSSLQHCSLNLEQVKYESIEWLTVYNLGFDLVIFVAMQVLAFALYSVHFDYFGIHSNASPKKRQGIFFINECSVFPSVIRFDELII